MLAAKWIVLKKELEPAEEMIDCGAAYEKLQRLIEASQNEK